MSAGEDRTNGIWGLLALFVVIGVGSTNGSTNGSSGDGSTAPSTTLPPGVTGVLRDQGTTVLSLDVPAELGTAPTTPVVAPVRVRPSADGSSITILVSCARSQAEAPAQVSVTETDDAITVLAVTLVPEGGAPCDPAATPREVAVSLERPVAGRSLIAVPGGTAIPGAPS